MNFLSQNGVIWCILGVLFLRFTRPVDCSCTINFTEVPLKGKNKTLVKIVGVATPATAAALMPMAVKSHIARRFAASESPRLRA